MRPLWTATVLARSVVLARDESHIAETFDRIEPLVSDLRRLGRAGLPIKRVMRHIGDVLDKRSCRLEIAVVLLIAFEIAVSLVGIAH